MNEKYYSGYFLNNEILYKSSSGGAAYAFSRLIINQGGVCVGVKYCDRFTSACFGIAKSIEELVDFSGTKYFQNEFFLDIEGEKKNVYEAIGELLISKQTVLFIGKGCEVRALLGYLKHNNISDELLYTIDIICQGPTYKSVQKDWIHYLENKCGSTIAEYNVKDKHLGWGKNCVSGRFDNGAIYRKRWGETDFHYAFIHYTDKKCFGCINKGTGGHLSDITIGDRWGLTEQDNEYNKYGVSLIISRSIKGESLLNKLKEVKDFFVSETDGINALKANPMYTNARSKDAIWQTFDDYYRQYGLHKAVVMCQGGTLKYYSKLAVRNLKKFIPAKMKRKRLSL